MTLNNFKQKMIEKAQNKGSVWENFGQTELSKLKEKYSYNDLQINDDCLTKEKIKIRNSIDEIDDWLLHFDLSQLKSA